METNNTRKTNKNKNKKHKKKTNYPFKQHNSKNTRIAGKTAFFFFIDWKQNKQQDKSKNTNEKQQNTKNKANIETERLKHTPWKQKQEQQKKK